MLFLIVALMGTGAALGVRWGLPELHSTRERLAIVELEASRLGGQLEAARARSAIVSHEAAVMREANTLLKREEQDNQERISALESDLELYRRLGGATGSQRPLAVRHAELVTGSDGTPQLLALTLTQNLLWAADIAGSMNISLLGQRGGVSEAVGWQEISSDTTAPTFAFKYFQLLELPITIPPDFEPSSLEVTLRVPGGEPFVDRFAWEALLPPSNQAGRATSN